MRRLLILLTLAAGAWSGDAASSDLPIYRPAIDLAGGFTCAGSSTVTRILQPVVRAFRRHHPQVAITTIGGGSATGPQALIGGTAQLAMMSRPFSEQERTAVAASRRGEAVAVTIALDALAVYVPVENPIAGITLVQLDGIMSSERRRGSPPLISWGQLGLTGDWSQRPITAFGFSPNAGGGALVQELVLQGASCADHVTREHVSSSIVQGVASEPGGIGVSSVFMRTPATRTVPVGVAGPPFIAPTRAECIAGRYPLMRRLQIWTVRNDGGVAEPMRSFLRFACSAEGQEIIAKQGEFALDAALAREQQALVGGTP